MSESDRIAATTKKIQGFKNLPQGWHYGEGVPPSDDTINKAVSLNIEAANSEFTKTNAFPGIDGEIQFTIYQGEAYLEFTIETNGSITFLYEENNEEKEYQENLSFNEAVEKIRDFKEKVWPSSELFTNSITTQTRGASRASLSNLPATIAVSQFLIKSAPYVTTQVFVSTSRDITSRLPVILLFSGTSRTERFLTNVVSTNKQASRAILAIATS
ncbi:MAG: hypothetical protein L0229_06785 [Blastocatellia bacterium]|nr:hypothetical protein [Blastocatellia bacterium]